MNRFLTGALSAFILMGSAATALDLKPPEQINSRLTAASQTLPVSELVGLNANALFKFTFFNDIDVITVGDTLVFVGRPDVISELIDMLATGAFDAE